MDQEITWILAAASRGDPEAATRLWPRVYEELRKMSSGLLRRRETPAHMLQATALVHEAFLRLVDQTQVEWRDRAHFFAIAAQAMRRILIDHARARRAMGFAAALLILSLAWWWRFLYAAFRRYLQLNRRSAWALLLSTQSIGLILLLLAMATTTMFLQSQR